MLRNLADKVGVVLGFLQFLSVAVLIMVLASSAVQAHNTGRHEAAAGGPCWIWELPVTPIYCIFVHGTRHDHPYPQWLADRPSSDV